MLGEVRFDAQSTRGRESKRDREERKPYLEYQAREHEANVECVCFFSALQGDMRVRQRILSHVLIDAPKAGSFHQCSEREEE